MADERRHADRPIRSIHRPGLVLPGILAGSLEVLDRLFSGKRHMTHSPRDMLAQLMDAALKAADPATRLAELLPAPPPKGGRSLVIGAGKAAANMARAVEQNWPYPLSGLVITRYGHGLPLERIEVIEAGHPLPDAQGRDGAARIQGIDHDFLKHLGKDLLIQSTANASGETPAFSTCQFTSSMTRTERRLGTKRKTCASQSPSATFNLNLRISLFFYLPATCFDASLNWTSLTTMHPSSISLSKEADWCWPNLTSSTPLTPWRGCWKHGQQNQDRCIAQTDWRRAAKSRLNHPLFDMQFTFPFTSSLLQK